MKNRLFKNYVTTAIGVACIGAVIYMHLKGTYTMEEKAELAALGLLFIRSKDSLIGLGKSETK